jgi:UDP-N-acetylmuramoyl-tripeptide--D-alanyl-D-alanine ligase
MILPYLTRYLPSYPKVLLYMLQDTEYRFGRYLTWYHRTLDFRRVIKRRQLDMTKKVKLLLLALWAGNLIIIAALVLGVYHFLITDNYLWLIATVLLVIIAPFIAAYGILVPLFIGWLFVQKPREAMIIAKAKKILATHPGRRIGIAGSFGKTTAKELLLAVLSEGVKVAATPGNMNTPIGISRFAGKLTGHEDFLIFELGEEKPGDVRRLSRLTKPEIGIITGVNEAHLASFKTLDKTIATVFELADFVESQHLYKNRESELVKKHKDSRGIPFDRKGVDGWKVTHAETTVTGTEFDITKRGVTIHAQTHLVGLHTIGMTTAVIAIAHSLGLTPKQIEAGLQNVQPFEHRMQPRPMHGAWVIDDTYNGNSEGVKAGLEFLKHVDATRRIYVTPGLVEQGDKTQFVHEKIGEQAATSADIVVLMQNSVTEFIKTGLKRRKFKGQLIEIDDPLEFYSNLEHFVAAGDVVMMQNDWTDNYQ